MSKYRRRKFEALENRLFLAVTASVTDGGDLVVEGDADGAVEIVAVSEGAYRVTDNGVVIADETTLQGVTDDFTSSWKAASKARTTPLCSIWQGRRSTGCTPLWATAKTRLSCSAELPTDWCTAVVMALIASRFRQRSSRGPWFHLVMGTMTSPSTTT